MKPTAKVASLFIYPIKSCRGISVSQAPLTPTGFRWDRYWSVVDSTGKAYSQKVEPKLCLVVVELPHEAFMDGWEPTANSYMEIKAPRMNVLKIPLKKAHDQEESLAGDVSVWDWSGSALDEGSQAAKWYSDYLGKPSRLVRFNEGSERRAVDPNFARGQSVMFSNGYPFMLLSQGSLDALNKLLKQPVPINRFRPNILVDGCEPFAEDLWTEISINNFTFDGVKLCSRSQVPAINQDTGIVGSEPADALNKIRSDKVLRPNQKQQGKTYFGQNLVWNYNLKTGNKGKMLKVGDAVFVSKKVASAAEAAA